MMKNKNFYITTTLPYVNAEPHIGHAVEFIRADVIARYKTLTGFNVFFNTGTDEHGLKVYNKAVEEGKDVQKYADFYALKFKGLIDALGLTPDVHFVRTTDPHHLKAAQHFWTLCEKAGDIYKKAYKIKYCVGCELEKTDSELIDGKCPIHPQLTLEIIEEENYFFRFSKYQKPLLDLYAKTEKAGRSLVVPESRLNEIKAFVARGLEDFSISRLSSKMPWGVPVPGDVTQVMYVWFDALVSYISTLGWPENAEQYEKFWVSGTPVQYCGKDNLRQQSAMWQAMLLSAGLAPTHTVVIDGFVTGAGGVKMSKSLGNVFNPYDIVAEYGTDALRYFVLRELSPFEDSPFTIEQFKRAYNANLANGLGNLVSRIMKMAETNLTEPVEADYKLGFSTELIKALENFNLKLAMDHIWELIAVLDGEIQAKKPFALVKNDPASGKLLIKDLVFKLGVIVSYLEIFLPETAGQIKKLIRSNKSPAKPLFMRRD